jgi:ADP-ribose pyrophosphatase
LSEESNGEVPLEVWQRVSSERIADCRVFRIRRDVSINPRTNGERDFFIIEASDWINVVPMTSSGEIVMIEQYRHGTGELTLEIPGGAIEEGESPAHAALRELLEETGYFADEVILLGRTRPNPATHNNWLYTFLARDAAYTGPPALDEGEDIKVHLVPSDEIPILIANGTITHALVITAFGLWSLYQENLIAEE